MPNKMYKKNILIVGGTGFIGYHLAKKAIQKKFSVTSLSTKPAKKIRYLKKVKYIYCDISNKQKLKNVIKKRFQYVVNLGGYVDHSNKKKTLNKRNTVWVCAYWKMLVYIPCGYVIV